MPSTISEISPMRPTGCRAPSCAWVSRGCIGVLITPGETALTLMPRLAYWGMTYTRDRIRRADLDPGFLMWGLRRRADVNTLPDHRIVVRFEFSGVPASRTKFRVMWLLL